MPFLLIDKPAGMTSHDVVDRIRRITGERTVGHAGTLDPFATGLLIIGVGRDSTKHLSTFLHMDKEYEADIVIGATTETLDTESAIILTPALTPSGSPLLTPTLSKGEGVARQTIERAIASLTGSIKQIPPMHSAIKVKGRKLYDIARSGGMIEVAPRDVTIHAFELVDPSPVGRARDDQSGQEDKLIDLPFTITARIRCSSGTYIRALARDLGFKLGTGGYLSALRRTAIGPYKIEKALKLNQLTAENWFDLAQKDMLL